ncbi:MAG: GNAT family N-acetyltransferase, partial [Anaerolineales bacterium]|nr:GNAT family N-acetyltransferase [Anaerolineales bacterium]
MTGIPRLIADRLILRPFTIDDGPRVQELAGDRAIAETTANIPHPYGDSVAETWISTHQELFENEKSLTLAITLKDQGDVIGAIGLEINRNHHYAELGYWIGKPYWNQGFCTEAAREVLSYGFMSLNLNRIQARHMLKNPASARVMVKIGMLQEGILRQSLYRFGTFKD